MEHLIVRLYRAVSIVIVRSIWLLSLRKLDSIFLIMSLTVSGSVFPNNVRLKSAIKLTNKTLKI